MFNFFQMMQPGQSHAGLDALARQFGLSQDQVTRATAALLPALFLGLQRSAVDPNAFARLMSGFNAGPFAQAFSSPAQVPSPQAQSQGEQVLRQIFGSTDLTRRVADEAATWSGVSAQVIQQMMPIIASGMASSLSNFSDMMRARGSAASGPQPSAAKASLGQPYGLWMEIMQRAMAGASQPAPTAHAPEPRPQTASGAPNPWAEMALAMMGQQPPAPPQPEPQPQPEPAPREAGQNNWTQLAETGREAQQQYIASLQNILDNFWGAGQHRR